MVLYPPVLTPSLTTFLVQNVKISQALTDDMYMLYPIDVRRRSQHILFYRVRVYFRLSRAIWATRYLSVDHVTHCLQSVRSGHLITNNLTIDG